MSLLAAASFLLVAGACGKSSRRGATPAPPEGRELPSQADENSVQPGLPEALPLPEEGREEDAGKRFGYRVQIAAFTEAGAAERRAEELRPLFGEPVHVVHEGLLHKVQVGDFVSRDRAEDARRRAIDLGLDGAFVVDTMIDAP